MMTPPILGSLTAGIVSILLSLFVDAVKQLVSIELDTLWDSLKENSLPSQLEGVALLE